MKNYKEFEKVIIGGSDIATLVVAGCDENGVTTGTINFGEDGTYKAYLVTGKDVEIGAHYKKVFECANWIRVYDDDECSFRLAADHITVWRAGEMGCIIQLWND